MASHLSLDTRPATPDTFAMINWTAIYKVAWIVLVALCCVGLVCVFLPKCKQLQVLQETKMERVQKNQQMEEDTKVLKIKREKFLSDPAFVELTAREKGMKAPTDILVKRVKRKNLTDIDRNRNR